MKLQEISAGDVVRVDDDDKPWKVTKRTKAGMLTLESLGTTIRIVWAGVYEFRVRKSGAF